VLQERQSQVLVGLPRKVGRSREERDGVDLVLVGRQFDARVDIGWNLDEHDELLNLLVGLAPEG
ncbi:MAG: hypothetical protein WA580_04860, partial [Acidimicrobiales bacterium]